MSSYASPYGSLGGSLFDQGAATITDIGNKYADNPTIGGMVVGSFLDAGRTQMNTGLALQYNTAMSSHLAGLTTNLENVRTGNQMKLLGAEGRIAKDLIGAQGAQDRLNIKETGTQQRLGIGAQGKEDRKNIQTAGAQERLNIGKRYAEERNMRADARGAIRSLGARFFG